MNFRIQRVKLLKLDIIKNKFELFISINTFVCF